MKSKLHACPICDSADLAEEIYGDEFDHQGQTLRVEGLERYACAECGAAPLAPDQIRRNHRRVADARRRFDGLLTGDEIRGVRDALGLTQAQAGELIGGGPMAFSKYERGDVMQSVGMDKFLRVLAAYPFIVDTLRIMNGATDVTSSGAVYTTAETQLSRKPVKTHILPGTANVVVADCWKNAA